MASLPRGQKGPGVAGALGILVCVASLFFARVVAGQEPTRVQGASEVGTARAVLDLTPEHAATGLPCEITGVVTCSSERGELLFVQDASAGVYVYYTRGLPRQGDRVRVRGRTDKGLFSPIVMADTVEVLGTAPLPVPLPVSIEQMASGRHDSQWVEVEGVVIRSEMNWGHLTLRLASGSARLEVRILEVASGQNLNWVDARVRVRGVAGTAYNQRRQLVGFHLLSQGLPLMEVLRPPTEDPFSAPLRASTSLMAYSPGGASERLVRLRGVVAWTWPGHPFSLVDESGGVRVLTREFESLHPGDLVEAAGFPAPTLSRPVLQEAVVRVVGRGEVPRARAVTAADAAAGLHDCERVTVDAVVLQAGERNENHSALVVEGQGKVFRVRYPSAWGLETARDLLGSEIRVTGLCRIDAGAYPGATGFSVWLQERSDLEILRRSRLWWQRVSLGVLMGMVAAVGVGGAWVLLMRRQVRRQTAGLRAREATLERRFDELFENSNDIILNLNEEGQVSSVNAMGETLLGLSRGGLGATSFESLLDPSDVAAFRALRRSLMEGHPRRSHELRFRARDGRSLVLEVNPRLQYEEGRVAGLQVIGKDVTARRAAEDAVRAGERQLRASLRDRERLGRNLHDGIIQSIYAAGLNLEDCARVVGPRADGVEERLRTVTGELNRVIR
ncbi:MAG: PAS domain S-box protein, partial [Verrucomicrobiales bacterium]|nr:PAS domain S-box protein [Verrucomicrobiales bacterium]